MNTRQQIEEFYGNFSAHKLAFSAMLKERLNRDAPLRQALQKLAAEQPSLRVHLVPLLRKHAAKWETLPKGWTQDSLASFWETLTAGNKHGVTKCISRMEDKMDDPGAFCASLADKLDPGWRSRKAESRKQTIPKASATGSFTSNHIRTGLEPNKTAKTKNETP